MAKDEATSLKGAELILENSEKNIYDTIILDEFTQLPNLPEGDYILTINQENCEPYTTALHLGPNDHIKLDVKLTPAKTTTSRKKSKKNKKEEKGTANQGDDKTT